MESSVVVIQDKTQELKASLKQRVLVLDGGMGTMIQSYKLEEAQYRGERFSDWHVDVKGNKSKWGSEQEAIEWLTK